MEGRKVGRKEGRKKERKEGRWMDDENTSLFIHPHVIIFPSPNCSLEVELKHLLVRHYKVAL